jgi:membrane protease YdiL (CAAX protease family)
MSGFAVTLAASKNAEFNNWWILHKAEFSIAYGLGWLIIVFLTVFIFSGSSSIPAFLKNMGMTCWPSAKISSLGVLAIVLGVLQMYCSTVFHSRENPTYQMYQSGSLGVRVSFVLFGCAVAPFFEEVVMRGYFYKIFRSNCGAAMAIGLCALINAASHWTVMQRSITAIIFLNLVLLALCLIYERERIISSSLLFHIAYNSTVILGWQYSAMGLALFILFGVFIFQRKRLVL